MDYFTFLLPPPHSLAVCRSRSVQLVSQTVQAMSQKKTEREKNEANSPIRRFLSRHLQSDLNAMYYLLPTDHLVFSYTHPSF